MANTLLAALEGGEFTTMLASYTVQLHIECDGATHPIQTGQSFVLSCPEGEVTIDPEGDPCSVAPLLRLLRKAQISSVVVAEPATLTVQFDTGHSFSIPADDQYEAWEVGGTNGLFIVAMPGGDIAIWAPREGDQ